MPALFGLFLFCLAPFRGPMLPGGRMHRAAVAGLATAGCLWDASSGVAGHTRVTGQSDMKTLHAIVRLMLEDASTQKRQGSYYTGTYMAGLQSYALRNVMLYDFGGKPHDQWVRFSSGLALNGSLAALFETASPVEWQKRVPGRTEEEKLQGLARLASEELDFVLLPDDHTLHFLETRRRHNIINTKTRSVRSRLLASGRWRPISGPLRINADETVFLYGKVPP